jgi:uncharacterized 2Fe-2S/4Fe-4S cluster protein (DUF4445 family)
MAQPQVRVTFQPQGRSILADPGARATELAVQTGLTLNTACGGAGTCGKCRVKITVGAKDPSEADKRVFDERQLQEGWRLACQTSVDAETVMHIPEASHLIGQHRIVTEFHTEEPVEIFPSVRKVYVELPVPTTEDSRADLLRLEDAAGRFKYDLWQLHHLPELLRQYHYKGTVVLADHDLIDFEPGDTTTQCLGVALDVGTTTLVGALIDLCYGNELAVASKMNPQVSCGDDVLSRIKYASSHDGCLDELRKVVMTAIDELVEALCEQVDIDRSHVYEVVLAGNTTMEHLLCGIDPSPLGQLPFVPAHARGLTLDATQLGIRINPRGKAYIFPVISGFVGGDIVAGALATNLLENQGTTLMIDIGTNGEIVLGKDGEVLAASTAAGPAFEGARITCGMRAATGAIEGVSFDNDVRYKVIDNSIAVGICGSALIDLTAELLRTGIVTSTGQLLGPEELPAQLPKAISRRVYRNGDGQTAFLVSQTNRGREDVRVVLTQRDIRELQLASGAIRAGVRIMLKRIGLVTQDIDCVLIAGGFGRFIQYTNAQRIGLLPAEIDQAKIRYVGNASLAGAKRAILSSRDRERAEAIALDIRHVELSLDSHFQSEFADAMIFPEQDSSTSIG